MPRKMTTPALDITPAFQSALNAMDGGGQVVFITGKAGTGKSTLLNYYRDNAKKKPVVLAPTGVAALNVQGQTIHSFFNFYLDITPDKINSKQVSPKDKALYKKLKTLIIDEVSMLRVDLLDCIDAFLRLYGPKPKHPFGGVTMIFIGDLYQLPPVVTRDDADLFKQVYATPYFFSAQVLKDIPIELIELDTVYRQKDTTFIELLNKVRNNSLDENDLNTLNQRFCKSPEQVEGTIWLATTNQKADAINEKQLTSLKGRKTTSKAEIRGDIRSDAYPTATSLSFKVGAQIMLLTNDLRRRWVNGSIATITAIDKDEEGDRYVTVHLHDSDKRVDVYPHTWEVIRYGLDKGVLTTEPVGTFTQFPFRLAWAITIHKSQGKTFDNVIIDMGARAFAGGQAYVALSRCRSLTGIQLATKLHKGHIRVDYRIYQFLTGLRYQQSEDACPTDDKVAVIHKAIKGKTPLTMTYLKANDTQSKRTIVPLEVGEQVYQGKTFLGVLAYCTLRKEERMFRVDRILSLN